jgi:ABC-2 type transport system permease protein
MTLTTVRLRGEASSVRLPGAWGLGLRRGALEIKQFFRQRDQVVFTFAFPVVFLFLFASIFKDDVRGAGITASQLYVPAMMAAGIMSTSFQSLGISIAIERDEKVLRRLLVVGTTLYDVKLPSDPAKWADFAWIFVLGLTACALLGIAISSVPKSGKSATSVVVLPFLVLQFISGVYIAIDTIPDWMLNIGALFPLKWMCQGLRGVFLPESAKVLEQAGGWEFGRIALVLGAWCVGGLLLCLLTFRWKNRRDG